MPVYKGAEMVEMLAVPGLRAYVADAQEEVAYGNLGRKMGVRTMTEHKWLTEEEVEQIDMVISHGMPISRGAERLIADWREMRRLHERLMSAETQKEKVQVWDDINDMLDATTDKPISHELADGKLNDGISTTGQGIDYLRGRDD